MMVADHAYSHMVFKSDICSRSGDICSLSPFPARENQARESLIPARFQTVKGQEKVYLCQ
jgi:hypothetical protein